MVDETSEQKRLKDRVALLLLIKHAAPLIDGVLALPMRNIRAAGDRAAGAAVTAATTRPGKSENTAKCRYGGNPAASIPSQRCHPERSEGSAFVVRNYRVGGNSLT